MAIEIKIAGTNDTAVFPDGTSPDVIRSALQKKFPQQQAIGQMAETATQPSPAPVVPATSVSEEPGKGPIRRTGEMLAKTVFSTLLDIPTTEVLTDEEINLGSKIGRVIGGLTPASPLTEFVAAAGDEAQQSKDFKKAMKKGLKASAIDTGLRLAIGGAPTVFKNVRPDIANKVKQGIFSRKAGKPLLKMSQAKQIRQEVLDEAANNPELLRAPKQTIDQLGGKAFESVKLARKRFGELVGEAKKAGIGNKSLKVNVDDVKLNLDDIMSRKGADAIAKSDTTGRQALKLVEDNIKPLTKKKLILQKGALKEVGEKRLEDIDNTLGRLNEIDSSRAFQRIYDKLADPTKTLTKGERAALKLRNSFSDRVSQVVDSSLQNAGLADAKQQFSAISKLVDDPLIKRSMKNKDAMTRLLKTAANEGKSEAFQKLKQLDSVLPKGQKFMDDVVKHALDKEFSVVGGLSGGENIARALLGVSRAALAKPETATGVRRLLGAGGIAKEAAIGAGRLIGDELTKEREGGIF